MSDAHHLYMAKQCDLGAVTLKGYIGIEVSMSTQKVRPRGDRKIQAQTSHTVGREETLSIEAEDVGVRPTVGTVVAMVATNAHLVGGNDTGGTDLTITCASIYIDSVQLGGLNQDGKPTMRIQATVHSADGFASGVVISAPA